MPVNLRPPQAADAEACGRIIYEAFKGIAERHGFLPDFPSVEAGIHRAQMLIGHPSIFGVVAESDGRVIGSNFLLEYDAIRAVGPITVDPGFQERGAGRRLMQAVLERARGSAGVRLQQDAFNSRSMSLYASLGFEVKEPIVLIQGKPKSRPPADVEIRPMKTEDLAGCAELCKRVHRFDRTNELRGALNGSSPLVVTRRGRITAYASSPYFWPPNHGVAETEPDMQALLLGAGAAGSQPLAFLLPTRQAGLFRWCLSEGLRVVKPMTLMAIGEYQEPQGCFFPSVHY